MDSSQAGPSVHDLGPSTIQMQSSDVVQTEAIQVDYISEWYTYLRTALDEKAQKDLDISSQAIRLRATSRDTIAWAVEDQYHPSLKPKIAVGIMQVLLSMKKIQESSQGASIRKIAPDGSLDLESLEKINSRMIEEALDEYAEHSRTIPNVTAVILASYAYYRVDNNPVNRAFMTSYVGDAVQDLNKVLKDLYIPINDHADGTRYAPVVALLQSSGSGKSRTAIQLSNTQVGLYLCVRHTPRVGQLVSAPPQDKAAYDSLVPADPQEGPDEAKVAVSTWLTAFATVFASFLVGQPREDQDWSVLAQNVATHLLSDVVKTFVPKATPEQARTPPAEDESIISGPPTSPSKSSELSSPREVLLHDISVAAETARLEHAQYVERSISKTFNSRVEATASDRLQNLLHDALNRLQKLVPDGCYVHLAIDEAVAMGSLRLTELRRCLSYIVFPKFRVLLLDTSNKVTELTGLNIIPDPQAESFRIQEGDLFLAPPFTRLPHDVFLWYDQKEASRYAGILTGTEPVTFQDLYQLLPLMGRPLLNDAYLRNDETFGTHGAAILWRKLTATAPNAAESSASPGSAALAEPKGSTIAAVSQRLPLDLVGVRGESSDPGLVIETVLTNISHQLPGAQTPSKFLLKQVALHMRTLLRVTMSGSEILSSTPSEPLLSLAVAHEFCRDPNTKWSDVINEVTDLVRGQHLHPGEHGEELSRHLLSFARDKAFAKRDTQLGCSYVSVTEYLDELLGPDIPYTESAKAWATQHWINFTHFYRVQKQFKPISPAPATLLPEALTRLAAVLGVPNQQDLDCVIPAYYSLTRPKSSDVFAPANVDALGIQQKNVYEESIGIDSESLKKDRCTSYIPAIASETGRVRALNLYLSMAAKPAPTAVIDNDKGISCILVKGCGEQQYPLIASLGKPARGKLSTFLGRYTRLAEETGTLCGKWSHKFALATGGAFFYQPGLDPPTGMPLSPQSSVEPKASQQNEAHVADETSGDDLKRKAEDWMEAKSASVDASGSISKKIKISHDTTEQNVTSTMDMSTV